MARGGRAKHGTLHSVMDRELQDRWRPAPETGASRGDVLMLHRASSGGRRYATFMKGPGPSQRCINSRKTVPGNVQQVVRLLARVVASYGANGPGDGPSTRIRTKVCEETLREHMMVK